MFCNWESHKSYQEKLILNLLLFHETEKSRVVELKKSLSKLYHLDLDNLLPIIKPLYSNFGRPAENQLEIIRSLVLMLDYGRHSITNWAEKVAGNMLLCVACGFAFGHAPSVGSCYNSGASHHGVKVCDCRSKGIYNCKCPRHYSDTDARWGWDSYHEQYFYGDTLFNTTATDSPYDLTIYLRIAQGTRHDSVLTIFALSEVRKLFPNFIFKNFIADGAMDNYPTYKLLNKWNIIPFIPLDSNARTDYLKPHPGILCFDDKENPICLGGTPYKNVGFAFPKGIKYRCWFDYYGIEKPCKCSESKYGRTIYIKPDYDLRLFPPIPRKSAAFKEKFKTRTSVERSNKRMLVDYDIEQGKCRSSKRRFARVIFAVINTHLDAWIKHTGFNIVDLLDKILANAA